MQSPRLATLLFLNRFQSKTFPQNLVIMFLFQLEWKKYVTGLFIGCKYKVIAPSVLTTVAPRADLQDKHKTWTQTLWSVRPVGNICLKLRVTKHFHLHVGATGTRPSLFVCGLYKLKVALTPSYMPVKLSVENLTSPAAARGRCRGSLLFPGPTPSLFLLLCVKAAEPCRHREDSPAGGRSHAIPPSRGPETGSLSDSSNTPHIPCSFYQSLRLVSFCFIFREERKKRQTAQSLN